MVLVQRWPFFQLFVLGNIGQENVFNDILELKNAFVVYKKKKFKKSKNWLFPQRVEPLEPMVLVQKLPFFKHFFLGNIGQENVF